MKIIIKESQLKNIVNLLMEQKLPGANAYQIQQFLIDKGFLSKTHPETGKDTKDGDFSDYSASAFGRYYYGVNDKDVVSTLDGLWNRMREDEDAYDVGKTTGFGPKMAGVLSDIIKNTELNRDKAKVDADSEATWGFMGKTSKGTGEMVNIYNFGVNKAINLNATGRFKEELEKFDCLNDKYLQYVLYLIWYNKGKISRSMGIPNDEAMSLLIKYSLAITGRETKFGKFTRPDDNMSQLVRTMRMGSIIDELTNAWDWLSPLENGKKRSQSLGQAQFTKTAWYKYGLDKIVGEYNHSLEWTEQLLGTMYRLWTDYKLALSRGVGTMPAVNGITKQREDIKRIKYNKENPNEEPKKMFTIDGTGNISLDLAILAHNMSPEKIKQYCETDDPDFAGPCDGKTYRPYKQGHPKDVGVLNVYQNKWIRGYFPNLEAGGLRSIGYVEEVQRHASGGKLKCLDSALTMRKQVTPGLTPKEIERIKDAELKMLQKKHNIKLTPDQIQNFKDNKSSSGRYTT